MDAQLYVKVLLNSGDYRGTCQKVREVLVRLHFIYYKNTQTPALIIVGSLVLSVSLLQRLL